MFGERPGFAGALLCSEGAARLLRAFAGLEKGSAFYLASRLFWRSSSGEHAGQQIGIDRLDEMDVEAGHQRALAIVG